MILLMEGVSLLREQPFQFCNDEAFLIFDRFYNAGMVFLQNCQCYQRQDCWPFRHF